jgi:UDP-N-acetylmuramyl pentapeptide phosphotransferase/UDP-N-acetylglucosamine-1-phosphate transferase
MGGIGVVAGFLPSLALPGTGIPVITALALGLVGFRDDVKPVSAGLRLMLQTAVCGVAVTALTRWNLLIVVGVVALVVGYINAFNFMDGVNGISGFNALVVGCGYAVAGWFYDHDVVLGAGCVLAGSALGFLPFNLGGRVFLGDVGSYAYGAFIGVSAVAAQTEGVPWQILVGPLVIYLADTGSTLLSRLVKGRNPLAAHRDHVYQRLTDRGLTHVQSASVTAVFALGTSLAGWLTANGVWAGLLMGVSVVAVYLWLPALLRAHETSHR